MTSEVNGSSINTPSLFPIDDKFHKLLWNHLNSWRLIFVVCQFFTGSWGSNFVDWLVGLKRRITPGKFTLFENELFFFTTVIAN